MSVNTINLYETLDVLFDGINEQTPEGVWRAYINRSYYIIFHELRLAMENANIYTNQYKTGTHDNLYMILDEMANENKSVRKLALQFKDFLKKRHKADYHLKETISWHDVRQAQTYLNELPKLIAIHIQ